MKKQFILICLAGLLLLSMAACGEEAPSSLQEIAPAETPSPEPTPTPPHVSATDMTPPSQSPEAAPEPSEAPAADDAETIETYRTFLSENYDGLYEACYGGISGIGFIDLDLDEHREMLIFDAGASASMGVQFFDCIDGQVECVSANMQPMGEVFGGEHFTKVYVNANYFEDFRLVEVVDTGERFFLVESGNGSLEFSYRELIRFGGEEGVLTLTPMFYKYEEYDVDTGDLIGASYRVDGADAPSAEYESANTAFLGSVVDLGLECQGVFVWNNNAYTEGRDSFLAMAEEAITLSENNRLS